MVQLYFNQEILRVQQESRRIFYAKLFIQLGKILKEKMMAPTSLKKKISFLELPRDKRTEVCCPALLTGSAAELSFVETKLYPVRLQVVLNPSFLDKNIYHRCSHTPASLHYCTFLH